MQGQNLSKAILDAIEVYTNEKIKTSKFVKTEIGVVSGVGTKKGNKVNLKGAEYDNIKSIGNIIFPKGCVVFLFIPNGQYSNMFILGQLDDTPANIVGGTINIGNNKFQIDENGNVDVNNGKVKILSDGAVIVTSEFEEGGEAQQAGYKGKTILSMEASSDKGDASAINGVFKVSTITHMKTNHGWREIEKGVYINNYGTILFYSDEYGEVGSIGIDQTKGNVLVLHHARLEDCQYSDGSPIRGE